MSSGLLVGALASELALEAICTDDFVQLEPTLENPTNVPAKTLTTDTKELDKQILQASSDKPTVGRTEPREAEAVASAEEPVEKPKRDILPKEEVLFPNALSAAEQPARPQTPLFSPLTDEEIRKATWDQVFEKAIRKEYAAVKTSPDQQPFQVAQEVLSPSPAQNEPNLPVGLTASFAQEKIKAPAPQTKSSVAWDEIFNNMTRQETLLGPPPNPTPAEITPKRKAERPSFTLREKGLTRPEPAVTPPETQVATQMKTAAPSTAPMKEDAPVLIFPSKQVNTQESWDDLFDSMLRRENSASPAPSALDNSVHQGDRRDTVPVLPAASKSTRVTENSEPTFPVHSPGALGHKTQDAPAPRLGYVEIVESDHAAATANQDKILTPQNPASAKGPGQCEDNGPMCVCSETKEPPVTKNRKWFQSKSASSQGAPSNPSRLLPEKSAGSSSMLTTAAKSAPEKFGVTTALQPTSSKPSLKTGREGEGGFSTAIPRTSLTESSKPIETAQRSSSSQPPGSALATQNPVGMLPAPPPEKTFAIFPPPPMTEGSVASTLPAPPSVPEGKAMEIPPPPDFMNDRKTVSANTPIVPPPLVAPEKTGVIPPPSAPTDPVKAATEKRVFSTAMPQTPIVAHSRGKKPQSTVFLNNMEKSDNIAELRKMIARSSEKNDKTVPKTKLPDQIPPPPTFDRTVTKTRLPEPVLPPAAPEKSLIIAQQPDEMEPNQQTVSEGQPVQQVGLEGQSVKQAAAREGSNHSGSVVPVAATGACPHCGRLNGGLPPHDPQNGGRCEGCGRGDCVPGRKPCHPCESHTVLGGFLCDLYECICCPDPCYEGKWIPQADAAFFAAAPRPQSQMRIGYDAARNLIFPDRSEFFWARADGRGAGPQPVAPHLGEGKIRYDELDMYVETAVGGVFSTFISYPYLSIEPEYAPHAAGFGDLSIGTKTLMFDCELLQVAIQMKTTIPTGNTFKGLGTGHLSLEPSLLFALKLTREIYLQGQLAEWIPIGGNSDYQGSIFHSHFSYNHVLCRILPDVPLIGTLEISSWTFQHGNYTDPIQGPFQKSSGATYVSMGPGMRLFVCDRIDFGAGTSLSVTEKHFAQSLVRMEFRFRY